ncbi:hypothetical protein Cgig2_012384 [Carnegiea gigantea]|uniref:Uncharacterized protein n=1 Tax=Carnegiea gigantea TaxID=171969 RepID=A0A9Q1JMJ1_9CARY|nr:hypothetical protein Cgig2_012384 [Carnegiea gigantea]
MESKFQALHELANSNDFVSANGEAKSNVECDLKAKSNGVEKQDDEEGEAADEKAGGKAEFNLRPNEENECNGSNGNDANNDVEKLERVHSKVGSVSWYEVRPIDQLSVTVAEHSRGMSDNVDKEKRNTKASKFNQSADFILAKDKTPPFEQTKNSKGTVKNNGEARTRFRMGSSSSKAFKNCGLVLDKLINHRHGWDSGTATNSELNLMTPASRKASPQLQLLPPSATTARTLDKSLTNPIGVM